MSPDQLARTNADASSPLGAFVAISALGALIAVLVGVGGDFPLSDDWSYAHAVRSLCEDGTLDVLPWTGTTLVLQALYGTVLCKLFGFSFTVLRISTLVLAVAGVTGFYTLAREVGVRGHGLALATMAFGLSPLYVNLAFTFMSDVPFVAFIVWAAYFYARGVRSGDAGALLMGSVCCGAAFLVRQHGVFLAAAAASCLLIGGELPLRRRIVLALQAAGVPVVLATGYGLWLVLGPGMTAAVSVRLQETAAFDPVTVADVSVRSLVTFGVLLAPIVAVALAPAFRTSPRATMAATSSFAAAAVYLYARDGELMFYLTNVLYDVGVGAATLRDTFFLGLAPPFHVGSSLGVWLTVLGVIGAAVLTAAVFSLARTSQGAQRRFVVLAFVWMFGTGVLLQSHLYLDRHLLPSLPFAILLVTLAYPAISAPALGWACAVLLAWWSVGGTHDYLEWNRARHAMLSALEAEGVDPRSIDGGVEYNGSRLARALGTWPTIDQARTGQAATRRSWWWVVDDQFVVTFRPLEGYAPKAQRTFPRWLPPGRGQVLLLERRAPRRP